MSILEVKDLTVRRNGNIILDRINLSVNEGELLGILGPNGAGKTTLFRCILALEECEGSISLFGYSNSKRLKVLPFVGYLPQRFSIDTNFPITVKEFVSTALTTLRYMSKRAYMLKAKGYEWSIIHEDNVVDKALDTVGLGYAKHRRIGLLSGGELQRALIARVIVSRPLILILDEPFNALDPDAQTRLYELLRMLNKDMNITIVVAAHDLMLLMRLAKSIACINKRLYFHGSKEECLSSDLLVRFYSESAMHIHMSEHG